MTLPVGFAPQVCGVMTFSTSPVAITVLTASTPASETAVHPIGVMPPPPSGTAGDGSEQADTLKQPTAVQSNDLSNFMFCIETPGSLEMTSAGSDVFFSMNREGSAN